ncbi:MAG: glycosyltransferase [Gammaproteobacteria bacterium]|nr:glycosyltransferase [Gammaproteobacteria bacterium]
MGRSVLFLAAENGALPNGKVGGLGDVIRDLPAALAARGWQVSVMTPAYGMFADLPGAQRHADVNVSFAGARHKVGLVEIPGYASGVRHFALDHDLFEPHGPGLIYTDDPGEGPFATDASKFAFFCAASARTLAAGALPSPDVVHLHDWQLALVLLLRRYSPAFSSLKKLRTVFTIHNLAMQGVRPLEGDPSALQSWFPSLDYDEAMVVDPRWTDCVNPLAVAIRLADAVNTVSPTYAREILESNDPARGFSGGEGLEADLQAAQKTGRLKGILNGCEYPEGRARKTPWRRLVRTMQDELKGWIARESTLPSAHYLADKRVNALPSERPAALLTSIGRLTEQKVRLFREPALAGLAAIESILQALGPEGLFVMVGSGDPEHERYFTDVASRYENFLFFNGYSEALADALYAGGNLFLMPSSFEPCGISQMLAMRAGQPCVVHGVGGLKDTVADGVNGFVFNGRTPTEQAEAFVTKVAYALQMRQSSRKRWQRLRRAAAAARFDWSRSVAAYEKDLYGIESA